MTLNNLYKKAYLFIIYLLINILTLKASASFSFATIPYQGRYKKIVTEHFVILFPKQLENKGQQTANYAEDIFLKLTPFMKWKTIERTTIIITDHTDNANGLAFPMMRNTIYIYAAPADSQETLKYNLDPLYSMIVHEYTHILHLDQIRGGAWFWRILYGKLYSPNSGSFRWYMEGMAVLTETKYASGGRLFSSYNNAIVRTAAIEDKIPDIKNLVDPYYDWPKGNANYQFGARFVEYLYTQYGEEKFQEFFVDISNDFWPVVLQFVFKFKKIYDKTLFELWDEWRVYEKEIALKIAVPQFEKEQLTSFETDIQAIDFNGEELIFSTLSYLYKKNINEEKIKRIHRDLHKSISFTNDPDYWLYTSPRLNSKNHYLYDIFLVDFTKKTTKQLTFNRRIQYISFSKKAPMGVYVSNTVSGISLYKADFQKGKIINEEKINLPDNILFIDQPSINDAGTEVVFSARLKDGYFQCFLLDLENNNLRALNENVTAFKAKWIDNENISFISLEKENDIDKDSLYIMNINTGEIKLALSTYGSVLDAQIYDNKIYYVDYTRTGEEIFITDLQDNLKTVNGSLKYDWQDEKLDFMGTLKDYETKSYLGGRYIYPKVWGFLPYDTGGRAYISNTPISIPFIGPQLMIYNSLPLGRFSYTLTISYDYLKQYPINTAELNFNFPFFNITYNWDNWAGGYKYYYNNQFISSHTGRFPINFSNKLTFYDRYKLSKYQQLGWTAYIYHYFFEENFQNILYFRERFSYSNITDYNDGGRWKKGIYTSLDFTQEPYKLLNNFPRNMVESRLEFRLPIKDNFFYTNIETGFSYLFLSNDFNLNNRVFDTGTSLTELDYSDNYKNVDIKLMLYNTAPSDGIAFTSADIGFDITLYRKSVYWKFATLGFREFYIKPFIEVVYLFNNYNFITNPFKGLLFDGVFELNFDLFVAYGNISYGLKIGGAFGYRLYDPYPSGGFYIYLSAGL